MARGVEVSEVDVEVGWLVSGWCVGKEMTVRRSPGSIRCVGVSGYLEGRC